MKIHNLAVIGALMIAIITSCKKDNTGNNLNGQAQITLKFTQVAASSLTAPITPFTLNPNDTTKYLAIASATDSTNNNYLWPWTLKYFISSIKLQDHNGNIVPFDKKYLLLAWDSATNTQSFTLGNVTPAHYHYIYFDIGIDSVTNHADPSLQPSTSVLSPQNPATVDMYWSWNSGYRFFVLEGKGDTVANTPQQWTQNVSYHLGTDAVRRTITIPLSLEAQPNTYDTVKVYVNNQQFLKGVDLRTEFGTQTTDNLPLANKIANNFQSAFTLAP